MSSVRQHIDAENMNAAVDRILRQPASASGKEAVPLMDPSLERVLARVRLRATRRAAWLRKLWSEEGEPGGQTAVTHAEIDTHLADRDNPVAEAEWLAGDPGVAALNRDLEEVEAALAADVHSRLSSVVGTFQLNIQEADLLQACLAVALDPSLARIYAYLHDHAGRGYVSEDLAARLFGHGRGGILQGDSPLRRWELIHERDVGAGEPPQLTCDPFLRDWLRGADCLDPVLLGVAEKTQTLEPLRNWPVEETAALIQGVRENSPAARILIQVAGPPGSGRRTLAAAVAKRLDVPLISVDTDRIAEPDWPRTWLRAQRQAYLDHMALAWHGEAIHRPWSAKVPPFPIQFAAHEPDQVPPSTPRDVVRHRVDVPAPPLDERRDLWRRYALKSAEWPEEKFERLVHRHRVTVGEIATATRKPIHGPDEAAQVVREGQRDRLGKLAEHLETTFTWDDLVVPEQLREQLEHLAFEAEDRAAFWEQPEARRLFPQGRGLLTLFTGPPGTGKTMAAQILAAHLGVDLFRIDLSSVVSKYVGETSQNLERILSRARHMDAILFFDEADALFGKRTEIKDAHDRFANTDTNYLLQAIEDYPGVAILSSNKKGNIDPAFIRRVRFVLELPKPDAEQRLAIWQRLMQQLAGTVASSTRGEQAKLNDHLENLASALELTGAQIKYAMLTGIFAARKEATPLALRHLLNGVDRELMKEGRALSERERRRIGTCG